MNTQENESLLKSISDEYLLVIPQALEKVSSERSLYGAIIPHFGWDFEVEDRVYWSSTLWTLDIENAKRVQAQKPNPADQFEELFEIENNHSRRLVEIDSDKLKELLTQWYSHQDEIGHGQNLVDEIGTTLAGTCLKLNSRGWNDARLTAEFVVYTDCCGDECTNFGLAECVLPEWKSQIEARYDVSIENITSRPK